MTNDQFSNNVRYKKSMGRWIRDARKDPKIKEMEKDGWCHDAPLVQDLFDESIFAGRRLMRCLIPGLELTRQLPGSLQKLGRKFLWKIAAVKAVFGIFIRPASMNSVKSSGVS
jgi:hypothetical protein